MLELKERKQLVLHFLGIDKTSNFGAKDRQLAKPIKTLARRRRDELLEPVVPKVVLAYINDTTF